MPQGSQARSIIDLMRRQLELTERHMRSQQVNIGVEIIQISMSFVEAGDEMIIFEAEKNCHCQ